MKKKILSMIMAGALVLSVSSVSQAAAQNLNMATPGPDGKYSAAEITANGVYEAPPIKVDLSDTTGKKVAINPYGLEVTATVSGLTGADAKAELVNKVETIENKSAVDLAVNATVKATAAAGVKLATAKVADAEKTNAVFAYLEMEPAANTTSPAVAGAEYTGKLPNQVVFAAKETTKKDMVVLDKTGGTNPVAVYKIQGSVAKNPTTIWTAAHTVDFSIVFDFEPRVKSAS